MIDSWTMLHIRKALLLRACWINKERYNRKIIKIKTRKYESRM